MGFSSGFGPLGVSAGGSASGGGTPGPPFAANSANNGLSVDAGSGAIVMGDNVSGVLSTLLSNREIPSAGFFLALSGSGNLIIGKNTNAGQKFQIQGNGNTGAAAVGALAIVDTWNTTGAPTLISASITNTASSIASNLMNLSTNLNVGFRFLSGGGVLWRDTVASQAMTWTPISVAAGGSTGAGGQSTSFQILARYGQASGLPQLNSISVNDFNAPSGGSGATVCLNLQQTVNQTGTTTSPVRGIYYNPQVLAILAGNPHIAYENVLGDNNFNTTGGVTTAGGAGAQVLNINPATKTAAFGDVNNVAGGTNLTVDDGGSQGIVINASGGILLTDPGSPANTSTYAANGIFLKNVNGTLSANLTAGVNSSFSVAATGGLLLSTGTTAQNNFFVNNAGVLEQRNSTAVVHMSTTQAGLTTIGDVNTVGNGTKLVINDAGFASIFTNNLTVTATITAQSASVGIKNQNDPVLMHTGVALTNFAAAALATLANAPVAGNPTKWIAIDDNGTQRRIPTW